MSESYPARGAMISLVYDLSKALELRFKTQWGEGTREQSNAWQSLLNDIQKLLEVIVINKSALIHKLKPKEMTLRDLRIVKKRIDVLLQRATSLASTTRTFPPVHQNATVVALLQAANAVNTAIVYLMDVQDK